MKKYFIASLCRGGGLIGGALVVDDTVITYKTNKLTVPNEYRNLEMKYSDITGISKGWLLILPIITIAMSNGETYKFFVVGRNGICKMFNSMQNG